MKALVSFEPGPAETLRIADMPEPVPAPDQLLVRVHAASLNYPDALMLEDLYQTRPQRPFATGGEVAGVVEAVGSAVAGFAVGDRVCGVCGHGGIAEKVVMKAWLTSKIPEGMGFDVASTMTTAYATTIHALLDRARLPKGGQLLVLGASGGTGMSAIELGKALGARVVAGVSTEDKRAAVLAAGADAVVVYGRGPFDKGASRGLAEAFKAACPEGYDVIYDPVGGDYAEPALRAIAWEGRYAVIGFTAGIPKIPLNLTLLKACDVVGVFWGSWAMRNQARFHEEMAMLFDLWRQGRIKPLISERFSFETAASALSRMRSRGAIGKLVVMMQ